MFNRRDFLKAGSLLGVAPLLPAPSLLLSPAPAIRGDGKFFVLCRVFYGMDVTLGLDPWLAAIPPAASDMFVEYTQNDLIDVGGKLKLGPAALALKKHAGDFSVVNGVFMSQVDNGHTASMTLITRSSHNQLAHVYRSKWPWLHTKVILEF